MSSLEQHLTEYLAVRRAMGYKLARAGKLLPQFTAWMAEHDQRVITSELALQWATCPPATGSNWHRHRLTVLRGFAAHLHAIDPVHEVPAADLLPWRQRRVVPYLYTDAEIMALMGSDGDSDAAPRGDDAHADRPARRHRDASRRGDPSGPRRHRPLQRAAGRARQQVRQVTRGRASPQHDRGSAVLSRSP